MPHSKIFEFSRLSIKQAFVFTFGKVYWACLIRQSNLLEVGNVAGLEDFCGSILSDPLFREVIRESRFRSLLSL